MATGRGHTVGGVHVRWGKPGGTGLVEASEGVPVDLEKKTAYFLRMHLLIVKEVTNLLRARFDMAVPRHKLHATLKKFMKTLNHAKKNNLLTTMQWGLLFSKYHQPSSDTFDVILLAYLLRNICGLKSKSKWWGEPDNRKIPENVVTVEADIARLMNLRNDVIILFLLDTIKK
jgi:hypothetical protein